MANKIFISGVIVFWLSSMTWLVSERILPSFNGGQTPVVQAYQEGVAVAWEVLWEGKVVGQAASVRLHGVGGSTDLHNRLLLDEFPVVELAPAWVRAAIGDLTGMSFDATTRVEFDPLGNFTAFDSRISLNDMPTVLRMKGRIEESYLKLKVSANDFSHITKIFLPNSEALNEILFPDAKMLNLEVGRTWQEKVYSPFSSPTNPVELVQVTVVELASMEHRGEQHHVMRVEYKSLSASGISKSSSIQGVSWVDSSTGEVLRREVYLGKSKLRFERMSEEAARAAGLEFFEVELIAAKRLAKSLKQNKIRSRRQSEHPGPENQ